MNNEVDIELDADHIDYDGCTKYFIYAMLAFASSGALYHLALLKLKGFIVATVFVILIYWIVRKVKNYAYYAHFQTEMISIRFPFSKKSVEFSYKDIETLNLKEFGTDWGYKLHLVVKFKNSDKQHVFICPKEKYDKIYAHAKLFYKEKPKSSTPNLTP
jgi:hypothetical protein